MKRNIKEANISGSRPKGKLNPGEGSKLSPITTPPQSTFVDNIRRLRQAGQISSRTSRTGPTTRWSVEDPTPNRFPPNKEGGITFISKPEPKKTEPPKSQNRVLSQQERDTVIASLPANRRRKLGLDVPGRIDLTHRGKPLAPTGKAAQQRIRDARKGGSETRLARGTTRKKIIREFIESYRKSILK